MRDLLNAEMYKLQKSFGYKIMLLGIIFYAASDLYFQTKTDMGEFSGVQALFDSIGSWSRSYLISGIFAGLFIARDFANRGIQTQISVGKSRLSVIVSKSLIYWMGCIGMAILYQLVYVVGISVIYGFGKGFNKEFLFCFLQSEIAFLFLFSGLLTFCILIAFCFKDVFIVTVLEAIFVIVGTSIMNSLSRIKGIPKIIYINSLVGKISRLYQFVYVGVEDKKLHYIRLEILKPDKISQNFNVEWVNGVWLEMGMAVFTTIIIFGITYFIFRRADLK